MDEINIEDEDRICRDCGELFRIEAKQREWFKRRAEEEPGGWSLPKRCRDCRAARRRSGGDYASYDGRA